MLTIEKINGNYLKWINYLKKYNCYSETMDKEIGELIKTAPFSMNENSGGAYQGGMIEVVLKKLCILGFSINENSYSINQKLCFPMLKVNSDMLMRVLLLQHISKAEMFVSEENSWKIKNGYHFDFNPDLKTKLKCGERSAFLCMKYGIELTEEEYEAMCVIDKFDEKGDYFYNPLSILVKVCNQLISVDLRHSVLNEKNKETKEE